MRALIGEGDSCLHNCVKVRSDKAHLLDVPSIPDLDNNFKYKADIGLGHLETCLY